MIAIFPEIAQAAAAVDLERLGILVRKYFGEDQKFAPRLDCARLLRNAGLEVEVLPLDTRGALLAKDEKGAFRIVAVVREGEAPEAQAFLLAHMFGHFLLHVQPLIARGEWSASGFREVVCPLRRYAHGEADGRLSALDREREEQADAFAAALLLPAPMLTRAAEKLEDVKALARFFGVTEAMVRRRMQQIGKAPDEPVNFIEAARKIGVKVGEEQQVLQSDIDPHSALTSPPADQAIPRSFAASSYGRVERDTDKMRGAIIKGTEPSSGEPTKEPGKLSKGLERLREIARKIDKSV